jgi:hypothetical protein
MRFTTTPWALTRLRATAATAASASLRLRLRLHLHLHLHLRLHLVSAKRHLAPARLISHTSQHNKRLVHDNNVVPYTRPPASTYCAMSHVPIPLRTRFLIANGSGRSYSDYSLKPRCRSRRFGAPSNAKCHGPRRPWLGSSPQFTAVLRTSPLLAALPRQPRTSALPAAALRNLPHAAPPLCLDMTLTMAWHHGMASWRPDVVDRVSKHIITVCTCTAWSKSAAFARLRSLPVRCRRAGRRMLQILFASAPCHRASARPVPIPGRRSANP